MRQQLAAFEVPIDRNFFDVRDPETGGPPMDLDFGDVYSFVDGYAHFQTCMNCSHALMEVWLADEVQVQEDTRWAVVVPFAVGRSGIEIDSAISPEPFQVAIPEGCYALLYELKLRDKDKAYYKSMWAKIDRGNGNLQGAFCRLTFIPKEEEVEDRELMMMHWSLRGLKSEAEDIV
jgi:hypothetical protein